MYSPWEYVEKYKVSKNLEHVHQVALFQWANMAANFGLVAANIVESYTTKGRAQQICTQTALKRPHAQDDKVFQLNYLFAIHNQGHGDAIRGAHAKAEGLKTGVPDICLPVRKLFTHPEDPESRTTILASGLYIELKRPALLTEGKRKAQIVVRASGKASTDQERWQEFLRQQGYVCEICYGWEEARDLILRYLKEGGLI